MSRYPLRNRTASQAAPSDGESELSSPHADPIFLEPSPTLGASALNERSYADVVGARVPAANRSAADASRVGNDVPNGGMSLCDDANPDAGTAKGVEPREEVNEPDNGGQWIPVGRGRRRHSAPSIDRLGPGVSPIPSNNTIDLAYDNLTASQREILERRERLLRSNDPVVPEQRAEPDAGTSKGKGKRPDPLNWGDVDFDGENLDPEAQAEALKLYNLLLKQNKSKKLFQEPETSTRNNQTDPPAVDPDVESLKRRMAELEAENNQLRRLARSSRTPVTEGIRDRIEKSTKRAKQKLVEPGISRKSNYLPSQQIPAGSFVGKALKSLADRKRNRPEDPDDSSESSSTSASSSNESSDSSRNARRKKRSKKKRHAKKKGKSLLKPVPPKRYNGEANLTLVYRFMTESIAYLEQGEVDEEYWIRTIASFLEGAAYDFYAQQVSLNIAEWTIDEFFEGLIDACFPADLLEQTRQDIDSFTQGSRSIKDYAAILKQKFEIVGTIGEQERVVKLWNGMKSSIRAELYREKLNPNVSSWADVVAAAEMLEMVENVRYSRHNRRTPGNTGETGGGHENNHRSQKGNRSTRFRNDRGGGDRSTPSGPSNGNTPPWKKDTRPKDSPHRMDKAKAKIPTSLSTKELDELRKAGKCFRCKGDGHMAKDCPSLDSVKSSNGSRPPGLPSHAVDIDFEVHEKLANQEDEVLHELEFNATHLHIDQGCETGRETLNDLTGIRADTSPENDLTKPPVLPRSWDKYVPMGDQALVACRAALEDLGKVVGFPGDAEFPFPSKPRWHYRGRTTTRFSVRRISNSDALITDRWQNNRRTPIPYHLLWDPGFNLPHWYAVRCCKFFGLAKSEASCLISPGPIPDILREAAIIHLQRNTPFRGDEEFNLDHPNARFSVGYHAEDPDRYFLEDEYRNLRFMIPRSLLANERFNLVGWYNKRLSEIISQQQNELPEDEVYLNLLNLLYPDEIDDEVVYDPATGEPFVTIRHLPSGNTQSARTVLFGSNLHIELEKAEDSNILVNVIDLHGQQIERGTYPALQRNAAITKDATRIIPKPIVVTVHINGHPVRALLDSGSLGDFLSTTVVEQLGLRKIELQTPLALQLAVQGSRSKINFGCKVQLAYQNSVSERYFDVANIANYDVILGTPWMFQHQVTLGINPSRVVIGSNSPQPLNGEGVTKLSSRSVQLVESNLEKARQHLADYAKPLCLRAADTPFPPLRDINHTIPLIDEAKVYHWRPARCPDPLREQWSEKWAAYIKSGRWRITNASNTVPMLLIYKPGTTLLRTVFDLRERNANTRKMTSPLPDIEGILRRVAKHNYVSSLDGCDAYEQIRVIPEHVDRTAVTTPNGNIVSEVLQQGDCNGPATYQALMNHLFSPFIGVFMDVYLDDIYIYSNTLEKHITHVKQVLDILKRERLYLSEKKMRFLVDELSVLGHIVNRDGIKMDPSKVDSILAWKTPTNRDLLRGFLGAVGYLADNIEGVRIPMGILSSLTGDAVPFRWEFTHQRAFEDVKKRLHTWRNHHRKPLDYAKGAPQVWLITDGCATGISGVVSQGDDWRSASIAAFYSAKLNAAQQNYAVHEIEMLAGVESMLRHRDILQGVQFRWLTDHKGLIHLLNQKTLTGRQARWLEKIGEFDFQPVYIPGVENVVSDALSRVYSNDAPGTVRANSEYTYFDVVEGKEDSATLAVMPVLVGLEAMMASKSRQANHKAVEPTPDVSDTAQTPPRVESSADFARRMVNKHFVLLPPGERKEGRAGKSQTNATEHQKLTFRLPTTKRAVTLNDHNSAAAPTSPNREMVTHPSGGAQGANTTSPPPGEPSHEPHSLVDIVRQAAEGINLLAEIRNQYSDDPTFKNITEKPNEFRNFTVEDGLVYLNHQGRRTLCIPHIFVRGRNVREIVIAEAHSLLAHLGAKKTLDYLRDHVWWKEMVRDTQTYCDTCMTCKRSKPNNQRPYGLLHPLPVAEQPWEAIGIDFVGPLPESKDRDAAYDSITVIIDLLTAMVHLVPSRTNYTARHVAELIFAEVYKHHGLPKSIVSDRDVLFTSRFWKRLNELIGTKLRMSSAYHPQSDGSTERANRTITQMIRQCVGPNQKDWVAKLPAIEFAINLAQSDSTGFSPFFLNTGRMPRSFIWDSTQSTEYPGVRLFTQQLKNAVMSAHDSILAARIKQTRSANNHRRQAPFQVDDLVYLSTENIRFPKGLARKFLPKYIGPYRIVRSFHNETFEVKLPSHLRRRGIHNTFHASLLRIHVPNDDRLFPGRLDTQVLEIDDSDPEWAVEEIVSHTGKGSKALFEIKWKSGDKTWMPFDKISHLQALQSYLDTQGIAGIADLPAGTGTPPDDPQVSLTSILLTTSGYPETDRHEKLLKPHSLPIVTPQHNLLSLFFPDITIARYLRPLFPFRPTSMSTNNSSALFDLSETPAPNNPDGLDAMFGIEPTTGPEPPSMPKEPTPSPIAPPDEHTKPDILIPLPVPFSDKYIADRQIVTKPILWDQLKNFTYGEGPDFELHIYDPTSELSVTLLPIEIWAAIRKGEELREGRNHAFHTSNDTSMYSLLAAAWNNEELVPKHLRFPTIDGTLVYPLGSKTPGPVFFGLTARNPRYKNHVEQDMMSRRVPHVKKQTPPPPNIPDTPFASTSSKKPPRSKGFHKNARRNHGLAAILGTSSAAQEFMTRALLDRGMILEQELKNRK